MIPFRLEHMASRSSLALLLGGLGVMVSLQCRAASPSLTGAPPDTALGTRPSSGAAIPERGRASDSSVGLIPADVAVPVDRRSPAALPLCFEANCGQADTAAQFLARGYNYQFLITPTQARFILRRVKGGNPGAVSGRERLAASGSVSARTAVMEFDGANPRARIGGAQELRGKINYLIGRDAANWRADVPTYGQVRVEGLYPGVDLVYYGNQRQLEYDFTIAPGADPGVITIHFEGVDAVEVTAAGELVLGLGGAEIRQPPPALYQTVAGARKSVAGGYRLKDARTVTFAVGEYDPNQPLIIDPTFSYSTFFGGNIGDAALALKVDRNGCVYIAGQTFSTQFPFAVPTNAFQTNFLGGYRDAFVAKLDSTGTNLVYFTYLGGSGDDAAFGLALDAQGNAYVVGYTGSADFPVTNALYPRIGGTADPNTRLYHPDGFVAELNTNGSALVYSTFLGGDLPDVAEDVAVDSAGNTYVTGFTQSDDFPTSTNALQRHLGSTTNIFYQADAFVTKIGPGGTNLIYSTYLGASQYDEGRGIAADTNGCAYVTGYTISPDFPITPNAQQTNLNNYPNETASYDAFVTKLGPLGTNLIYSTFLGGSASDYGYHIALDSARNAYVCGASTSFDFPNTATNVPGLYSGNNTPLGANLDAFLTKFDPNGKQLYSALFGGTSDDIAWNLAVDAMGQAFVVGYSLSSDFPTADVFGLFQTYNSGNRDVFVTAFNTDATALLFSGYLGGGYDDFGYGIALDPEGSVYLTGYTYSSNFPLTAGSFQTNFQGSFSAFLAKIRLNDPLLKAAAAGNALQFSWPASAPGYTLQTKTNLAAPGGWTAVTPPPVLTNGSYKVSVTPSNPAGFFRLHGN
jgi:hypothetical protein